MMNLLTAVVVSALVFLVSCKETCLHGWDLVTTVRETTLNKAIAKNSGLLSLITLPTIEAALKSPPKGTPGEEKKVSLIGYRIKSLKVNAVDGETQTAQLTIGFLSGKVETSYNFVNLPAGYPPLPGRSKVLDVAASPVTFRVKVTAYQINIKDAGNDCKTKNCYRVELEIVQKDAIVGSLQGGYEKTDLEDIGDIREGLTEMMKRSLKVGKKMSLAEFELPDTFEKTLFPRKLRCTVIYADGGNSVFAVLATTDQVIPSNSNRLRWQLTELNPTSTDAVLHISKNSFLKLLIKTIAKHLDIDADKLAIESGCSGDAKIYLTSNVGNYKEGSTLKKADITFKEGTNDMVINLRMDKDIMPGLVAKIYVDMELEIDYTSGKGFTVTQTKIDDHTEFKKEWYIILAKVLSPAYLIVSTVIEKVVKHKVSEAIDDMVPIGEGTGTNVVNVGGTMNALMQHVRVTSVRFINKNFVINFDAFK